MSMMAEERRFRIREMLSVQRTVSASELRELLQVTAATVRRDLAILEQEGVLVRSHGGAVSRSSATNPQPPYDAPGRTNRIEQYAIAREAERLVLDGETIFLEGNSAVYDLAQRLCHRNRLTVVTNSPLIVSQLQRGPNVSVICTGGELQKDALSLSGPWTQHALSEIRVDKAFLEVSAIDSVYGISTASQAECQIQRMVLKAAKVRVALADHSKFGNQEFAYVGPVTDIDILVTDSSVDTKYIRSLREGGVEVILADVRTSRNDSTHSALAKPRARAASGN